MELMSSLLLCALAAALPQALGEAVNSRQERIILLKPNTTTHKQILINMNASPLINSASEMQSVFKDVTCRNCLSCMERAIKAHLKQSQYKMLHRKPDLDELYYEVLNENHPVDKRSVNFTKPEKNKPKSKRRSSKISKSVSITKYSDENGKVFALKVKELNTKNATHGKKYTCKVYSVSQSLACDTFSFDGTNQVRTKKVKRDKKSKNKTTRTSSSSATTTRTTPFKKREAYNSERSEQSESFMPSVEEMF